MFDDKRVDTSGVDDRRGRRGGIPIALGGGGGIVAVILYLAVQFLGGGDIASLVPNEVGVGNGAGTASDLRTRCNAASAVGDDRIQQKTQGRVDPESWTHGSAQQRHDAFLAGYTTADPARCDALLPLR